MAKTWQNVLDESRVILKDSNSPERYTDVVLLAILNRGLQELRRLRPDAFWELFDGVDDVVVPEVVVTDSDPDDDTDEFDADEDGQIALTADFNIDKMFFAPLVYWVSSSAELVDDEYTEDGRAAMLMGQFKSMVVSL
jgi:hypothetical protein